MQEMFTFWTEFWTSPFSCPLWLCQGSEKPDCFFLFQGRLLNTNGIITSWPKLKTRWRKGLFPALAILFEIFSMIFQLAFVYEIGSTDYAKECNGQKDCTSLAIFHPERDSRVVAGTAGGWNKREVNLGQMKVHVFLQRHVGFHRRIFIAGKSHKDSRSLRVERTHTALSSVWKKGYTWSYCRVASSNPMLIYFLTN